MEDTFETIRHSYTRTRFYKHYWPQIQYAIEGGFPHLHKINMNTLEILFEILGFQQINIDYASNYYNGKDSTDRLICLCKATKSTKLILGQNSWLCHNLEKILKSGIEIEKQDFGGSYPPYSQVNGKFVDGLSVLDPLFNLGSEKTVQIIKQIWKPSDGFFYSTENQNSI